MKTEVLIYTIKFALECLECDPKSRLRVQEEVRLGRERRAGGANRHLYPGRRRV